MVPTRIWNAVCERNRMKGNSQKEEVAQHSQRLQLVGIVSELLCRGMGRSFYMCTVAPNKYVRYARSARFIL